MRVVRVHRLGAIKPLNVHNPIPQAPIPEIGGVPHSVLEMGLRNTVSSRSLSPPLHAKYRTDEGKSGLHQLVSFDTLK
jgi:hypothetical protein